MNCWYTIYSFIGHLLTEKFLIGCLSGVPGVSMQQDQSFCFLVSDVGPAMPESGDLSQHSVNFCLIS